jgi:RNA polymerase sigma-70 factor (ECF subfamily)
MDDPSNAADVVQEVFLKIFQNIGAFRSECTLKTCVYRFAVNEARKGRRWFSPLRRQGVGLGHQPGAPSVYGDSLPNPEGAPFGSIDQRKQALIEGALSAVNPKFRAALVLREIEGLSYEEISEILDVSLGTVKSRILRGRDALGKHLAGDPEQISALDWSSQLLD